MSENAAPGSAAPLDSAQKEQIRQLLRSHLPPPLHLPSTISALALELAQYDTQIVRVPQNMDQLLVQRAEVQANYTNCMGLFAPIRQIPTEILVEIFKMCWEAFVSTIGPGAGGMSLA